MKKDVIRVLQISNLSGGGIQSHIVSIYRNINREKFKFEFLVFNNDDEFYDEEVKRLGGEKKVLIPRKNRKRIFELFVLLKKEKYDIIDIPLSEANTLGWILCMRASGMKNICIHAHSTGNVSNTLKERMIRYAICILSKERFACSKEAAEYIFGSRISNKVQIEKNGIEVNKFAFSEKKREKIRKEININNEYVVGHIGRFSYPKNQEFLVKIFNCLTKKDSSIYLLLIGDGEDKEKINSLITKYNLEDKVIVLSSQQNIEDYYCAMDLFVLPSFFEGFPIVSVEAQASGLPLIVSDKVTRSVNITGDVDFLDLADNEWVREILSKKMNSNEKRKKAFQKVKGAGFDIGMIAKDLERKYELLCGK